MSSRRLGLRFTPGEVRDGDLKGAGVAVVDVLRATSVLAQAVAEGAARIVPAGSVESARALRESSPDGTLLCGERDGRRIPGFDLGNSPFEYSRSAVSGRTLVFCSTNGSRALVRCASAPEVFAASFVNAGVAAERLLSVRRDLLVVCAGYEEQPCVEDTAMGGLLVDRLLRSDPSLDADDAALLARTVWRAWEGRIDALLSGSRHGRTLASLGFGEDLAFCGRLDALDVLPELRGGAIGRSS